MTTGDSPRRWLSLVPMVLGACLIAYFGSFLLLKEPPRGLPNASRGFVIGGWVFERHEHTDLAEFYGRLYQDSGVRSSWTGTRVAWRQRSDDLAFGWVYWAIFFVYDEATARPDPILPPGR